MRNMKSLIVIAAALMAVAAGAAQAVNVNSYGGEVLLGPYYTTRAGQDTLLSVVNTTGDTKAIKVRFLEAMNSREVLDFNLYLSPYDVWTARITDMKSGAGIETYDNSCTVPMIPDGGEPFRNLAYNGRLSEYPLDGGPTDLDRTREGHIEIIEMGIADMNNLGYWDHDNNGVPDSTHGSDGIPASCQSLVDNWWTNGPWKFGATQTLPPTGGLLGTVNVIDVQKGTETDIPVTNLDDFSEVELHYAPGQLLPNLSEANPPISGVLTVHNDIIYDVWPTGIEAVSASLMTQTLVQEYTVNQNVEAESAWVVSMPTKAYHVDLGLGALAPFTEAFHEGHSCDDVAYRIFNREEGAVNKEGGDFSPMPEPLRDEICYETNVLNWNESDMFSSTLVADTITTPFRNGWATLKFDGRNNKMVAPSGNTYYGLPAIGFKATRLLNSNVGVGAAYNTSSEHRYARIISGSGS